MNNLFLRRGVPGGGTVIITVVLRLARTINHRWRVTRTVGKSMTFCTLIQKPIIDYCRSLLIDACMCQLEKKKTPEMSYKYA